MRSLLLLALVLLPVAAPAQVLRTLTSPNPEANGGFGSIANVGDLDGDGTADLAVGAVGESPGESPPNAGRAFAFSGATGELLLTLVSPNQQENGFFGSRPRLAGDLDGDGTGDLLVGATYEARGSRPNGGRAYAFSGATGALLFELTVPDTPLTGNLVGSALAGLGDVTGDGVPDLAVGDPGATVTGFEGPLYGAGSLYVLSGADGSLVRTVLSPAPVGANDLGQQGGLFAHNVAAIGDATADGVPDLAVLALGDDLRGGCDGCQSWALYLFSGATSTLVWTARRPVVTNSGADLGYGDPLAVVGDVDGDGVVDLVVGSPTSDALPGGPTNRGAAFVISGRTGAILHGLSSPTPADANFAYSVGAAGDADGDGTPDVAVLDGVFSDGPPRRVRVFSGATGGEVRAYATPNAESNGGGFGSVMTTLGDLDGDGRDDLVVAAASEDVDGVPNAGRVYIFSGMPVAGENAPPSAPALTVSVSPNPARSSATLSLRLAEASPLRVAVVDALGRVVRRLDAGALTPGAHRLALDVDGLPAGVYVVRVTAVEGSASTRLVVGR